MQFLRRLQERIVDHPWLTIGAVLIITAVFIYYIPQVQFESDFKKSLPKGDPAVQALDRAEKIYGSQDFFSVLIETPDTIFKVPTIEKIQKMETELKALEIVDKNGKAIRGVDDVRGPTTATVISATEKTLTIEKAAEILPKTPEEVEAYRQKVLGDSNLRNAVVSENGKSAAILIKLNPYLDDSNVFVDKVNQVVAKYQGPEMKIYVGGIPQIRDSIQQSMRGDLGLLIPLVILVMELVLLFAFRTGRGVGLPFLLMVLATIWTVGTMAITHSQMTAFSFFMPVMLIIASKAYAIYTVNRYYEEAMHHGKLPKREIILNTMNDMAKPLFMDGLTEIAGFLSLLAASFWPQQSFGLFIAVGIFYTFILNFTLIPAILAVLPVSKKQYDYEHGWLPNALAGFGRFIDRRRGWVMGVSAVLLIGFAVAIPHLKVETTPQSFLGPNHPALIASNALERDFGGSYQISIEVNTEKPNGLQDPTVLKKMVALQEFMKLQPEYGGTVSSLANLVREMNQKFHADDSKYYLVPDDPRLAAQLLTLFTFSGGDLGNVATNDFSRGEVVTRTKQLSSTQIVDLTRRVNSFMAQNFDGTTVKAQPVGSEQAFASLASGTVPNTEMTLLIALLAAILIVALLLRSIVAALISVVPMILTIVMNLGTMSLLKLPLDLASLMIGSIAVGVGIDYTINFIIRWREEAGRGHDLSTALEITMRTMGRGILLNAITLSLGFAVFYFSQFQGIRNFGLLINLTMIWSFLGAFTLIPALLLALKPRFMMARRPQPAAVLGGATTLIPTPAQPESEA